MKEFGYVLPRKFEKENKKNTFLFYKKHAKTFTTVSIISFVVILSAYYLFFILIFSAKGRDQTFFL